MRYIVQKAEDVGGPPIPETEPCIVIRGQDVLAVEVMDFYLKRYGELPAVMRDQVVVNELAAHRRDLIVWQGANPIKVADR